jgi:hypothetical protein
MIFCLFQRIFDLLAAGLGLLPGGSAFRVRINSNRQRKADEIFIFALLFSGVLAPNLSFLVRGGWTPPSEYIPNLSQIQVRVAENLKTPLCCASLDLRLDLGDQKSRALASRN